MRRHNPEDLDQTLLIRGASVPVSEEVLSRCQKQISLCPPIGDNFGDDLRLSTAGNSFETPSRNKISSSSATKTPSRSIAMNSTLKNTCTPLRSANAIVANNSSHVAQHTPRQKKTPLSYNPASTAKRTPRTPCSADRSVGILQWLSSTKKTPATADDSPRPSSSGMRGSGTSASAVKRAGIKRKLTEVMEDPIGEEEEENILNGIISQKRPPISPTKNILTEADENDNQSCAVKMLHYGKISDITNESVSKSSTGVCIEDSVKPFDSDMFNSLRKRSFRGIDDETESNIGYSEEKAKNIPNRIQLSISNDKEEPQTHKPFKSKFDSPTANLPNFVIDGTSPRTRPRPIFQSEKKTNWLESLSQQKKINSNSAYKKKIEELSAKKNKNKLQIRNNRITKKYLKIIALTDSPITSGKTKQTRLNFLK